jgi:hypothetical protein
MSSDLYLYAAFVLFLVPTITTCGVVQAIQDNPYTKAANEAETKARQDVADAKEFAECYVKEYLACVDMALLEYDFCKPGTRISETCAINAEEMCSE